MHSSSSTLQVTVLLIANSLSSETAPLPPLPLPKLLIPGIVGDCTAAHTCLSTASFAVYQSLVLDCCLMTCTVRHKPFSTSITSSPSQPNEFVFDTDKQPNRMLLPSVHLLRFLWACCLPLFGSSKMLPAIQKHAYAAPVAPTPPPALPLIFLRLPPPPSTSRPTDDNITKWHQSWTRSLKCSCCHVSCAGASPTTRMLQQQNELGLAIGSRAHMQEQAVNRRSWHRFVTTLYCCVLCNMASSV